MYKIVADDIRKYPLHGIYIPYDRNGQLRKIEHGFITYSGKSSMK